MSRKTTGSELHEEKPAGKSSRSHANLFENSNWFLLSLIPGFSRFAMTMFGLATKDLFFDVPRVTLRNAPASKGASITSISRTIFSKTLS